MKVSGDGRPKLLKELWELVDTLLAVSAEEEKLDVPVFQDFFHPLLNIGSASHSKQALSTRWKPCLGATYPQWRDFRRFSCLHPEMFNHLCKTGDWKKWARAPLSQFSGSGSPPGKKHRGLWSPRKRKEFSSSTFGLLSKEIWLEKPSLASLFNSLSFFSPNALKKLQPDHSK